MRILLSNDDGVRSPGLAALRAALSGRHEVWVVAPDTERSGCSHAVTVDGPVVTKRVADRVYACGGLPVDCVNIALAHLLDARPDVVVSGINLGANLGTDLLYSGTAAVARQAALKGLPSMAVSVAGEAPWHFELAARFVLANVHLLPVLCPPGSQRFLNVNLPNASEGPLPVRAARLARTSYTAEGESFAAPTGEVYYFYRGRLTAEGSELATDLEEVRAGAVAVTLVDAHPREAGPLDAALFGWAEDAEACGPR